MTQQVVQARTKFQFLSPLIGGDSFDTTWEALGSSTDVDYSYVQSQITTFLDNLSAYAAYSISQATNACSLEIYDITAHLDGSAAGAPVSFENFTWSTGIESSSHPLPEAAAILFGYRAAYGTDPEYGPGTRPRARDRGRFYIGPLNVNATYPEPSTGRCIWETGAVTAFQTAYSGLLTPGPGPSSTSMVQWSRANAMVKQIATTWIDDAPRYQRRRIDPSGLTYPG